MPWSKSNVVKNPAIFPQCDFALGAAVEVIKDRFRNPLPRDRAEVFDAHNPGRRYRTGGSRHLQIPIFRNLEAGRYPTTARKRIGTEISRRWPANLILVANRWDGR